MEILLIWDHICLARAAQPEKIADGNSKITDWVFLQTTEAWLRSAPASCVGIVHDDNEQPHD